MKSRKVLSYYFPFFGNSNIEQFLKFSEAYHPLDYLIIKMVDDINKHITSEPNILNNVLERLISWIEREMLGKVKSFKDLESMVYVQNKSINDDAYKPTGIKELIESMIPYRYYEALPADQIEILRTEAEKIYKDAINNILSLALDKPSLMPEQLYVEEKSKIPEFKQEDILTPLPALHRHSSFDKAVKYCNIF